MVRTYVRKTTRASWSSQSLFKAMDEIQRGVPLSQSAKKYGIPQSTIRRKLKLGIGVNKNKGRFGRSPTFSDEQEESLTNHILKIAQLSYKLSNYDIRRIAFKFAEENNIPHQFAKESGLTGRDWYLEFMKRHPELNSIKWTSKSRSAYTNGSIKTYFDNLENLMKSYNFSKDKIFNVDITVSEIRKKKDESNGTFSVSAEKENTVTVFCAFSASGIYVPPLFFYPDGLSCKVRTRKTSFKNDIKNDWSKEEFLLQWLLYFHLYINTSTADPVLIILDCHFCNPMTMKIFNFCERSGILLLGIPIYTFHILQPLDQNFIQLLKIVFNEECEEFFRKGHKEMGESNFLEIFDRAYTKVAMENDAKFAFEKCGIIPFNRNKFTPQDFELKLEVVPSTSQICSGDDGDFDDLKCFDC